LRLAGGTVLPGGRAVTSVSVRSGTTALSAGTNQWFCLIDQSLNVLAKTVDDTSVAWAANAAKTLNLSSVYTPANTIAAYVGVVVVATTPPSLLRTGGGANGNTLDQTPKMGGTSTAGLTNPASLGATAGAISGGDPFYAYVS
jgi:hypothetical protein